MSLLALLLVLVIIGVLTWAITTFIPMEPWIRNIIRIVAVIVAVVYVLSAFGLFGNLADVKVPTVK